MPQRIINRRSLLIGTGALIAGAGGLLASNGDIAPLGVAPPGWYLISRVGASSRERQLVAYHTESHEVRTLSIEQGTAFLSAALSPDGRSFALLKRVTRGSMPTDSVEIYDLASFNRRASVEVQIAFQRTPTFTIGWSADASHIAVSYDLTNRTLLFRIRSAGSLGLQAMLDYGSFRYHPTRPDLALYTSADAPDQTQIGQLVSDVQLQPQETIDGIAALWSPDGSKLAYQQNTPAGQALVVRDETTRQQDTLAIQPKLKAWAPDGSRLLVYGLVSNDTLQIAKFIPPNLIPGWRPGAFVPRLVVYDPANSATRSLPELRPGFQPAHLQWLHRDWLLVVDVKAKQSFLSDRRGGQRLPVDMLDDYTPMLRWLPQI
jgi:hypothetical protein